MLGLWAQETSFQVGLRNCSEDVEQGVRLFRTSLQQKGQAICLSKIIVKEEKPDIKLKNLALFFLGFGKMQKSGIISHFFYMHLGYLEPASHVFDFSHSPNSSAICWITGIVFPFGRPYSHLKAWNHWLLLHSCLLIWQEVSHFKTESSYWLINWVLICGQITQKKKGNTYGNDCLLDYFFLVIYRN